MKKITVVGWYGTETIGDRAILAGLISFFYKSFGNFEINLGSLYPFFSERTINEDYSFYKEIIGKDFKIEIFNSKRKKELDKYIKNSDLIVMGGGPLLDISEIFMIEYAFKKAKTNKTTTAILGSGIGPLFNKTFKKSVIKIINNSDFTILRDNESKNNLADIFKEHNQILNNKTIFTSFDPAVECLLEYKKKNIQKREEYIAVNFRKFPVGSFQNRNAETIDEELFLFLKGLAVKYKNKQIKLVPMHYFHIGNDDRAFFNDILLKLNCKNVIVQNENLTLKETIKTFQNALFNIGMRYHSIVFQTIINGRNFVLDYTEPKKGKIFGFIKDMDKNGFYNNRYIPLQRERISSDFIKNVEDEFVFDFNEISTKLAIYSNMLRSIS